MEDHAVDFLWPSPNNRLAVAALFAGSGISDGPLDFHKGYSKLYNAHHGSIKALARRIEEAEMRCDGLLKQNEMLISLLSRVRKNTISNGASYRGSRAPSVMSFETNTRWEHDEDSTRRSKQNRYSTPAKTSGYERDPHGEGSEDDRTAKAYGRSTTSMVNHQRSTRPAQSHATPSIYYPDGVNKDNYYIKPAARDANPTTESKPSVQQPKDKANPPHLRKKEVSAPISHQTAHTTQSLKHGPSNLTAQEKKQEELEIEGQTSASPANSNEEVQELPKEGSPETVKLEKTEDNVTPDSPEMVELHVPSTIQDESKPEPGAASSEEDKLEASDKILTPPVEAASDLSSVAESTANTSKPLHHLKGTVSLAETFTEEGSKTLEAIPEQIITTPISPPRTSSPTIAVDEDEDDDELNAFLLTLSDDVSDGTLMPTSGATNSVKPTLATLKLESDCKSAVTAITKDSEAPDPKLDPLIKKRSREPAKKEGVRSPTPEWMKAATVNLVRKS